MHRSWIATPLLALFLFAGACAGSREDAPDPGRGGDRGDPGGRDAAVSSIEDVRKATVYIEARGGAYDEGRGFGEVSYGSGSGFIVGDGGGSGKLVITNNHVVTGAGFLQVYLDGQDEPVDARVLGASECSDLALLELEGGGYPYLSWRTGDIDAGLGVRAAGYPADDVETGERPDYTITSGSINSTEADGETPWASVDSVLEHDVLIRPGNSGGPLVDENGRVVGVNYASRVDDEGRPTGPQLAIARDEARTIVDKLRQGDVESIGVNGEAFSLPEQEISGIRVTSVKTDSPAGRVGLRNAVIDPQSGEFAAFDVITEIEGTRLGEGGTMEEYCNILRQHEPDDRLSIQAVRVEENGDVSLMEGALNGEELAVVETIPAQTDAGGEPQGGFVSLTDDTGTLTMEVPAAWSDVRTGGSLKLDGESLGPAMLASTDAQRWIDTFEVPGVYFAASSRLAERFPENPVEQILDLPEYDFSGTCRYEGREGYQDSKFTGAVDTYTGCDGTDNAFQIYAATPPDGSYVVVLQAVITSEADLDGLQRTLATFDVLQQP
ncbi:peptidase S1 and S6, chymotrypsin/Hap [Rubrobacter xylanophilus DSM 9941]|uniref:Peptidase S1 and S6, chymotrypsin/Hap n=1 Tax=Rubrobacter xylanophilus (strain DSM 9941 / JCM 11954 / NBRC 16129 / PRD-1) TaxID=266117 RepID=Q1AZ00_RUBXD|nr:S1C family serine protease [Rubrobacter xylanophilus]ABG03378.1 peptidase S1 and S6, chymotrypsin/Hap [Rubrobacter xylanophilus DSM 9941]